jgi:hypothetical protein
MALAFAFIIMSLGAALLWMGWRGKGLSDVFAMLTGKGAK